MAKAQRVPELVVMAERSWPEFGICEGDVLIFDPGRVSVVREIDSPAVNQALRDAFPEVARARLVALK